MDRDSLLSMHQVYRREHPKETRKYTVVVLLEMTLGHANMAHASELVA